MSALADPHLPAEDLPHGFVTWFFVLNIGTVILVVFVLLHHFVGQRNFFQERSEMLLLNILPKEISEALKGGPRTIAVQFDDASVLFADVVGFTPMAARMTPLGLVDLLNEVFQCFDTLVGTTTSRRSRRSGTATWSRPACRDGVRTMPRRWSGSR